MTAPEILVVEDEGIVAMDIEERLENMGYSVCGVVASGEEAVQKAKSSTPDLVLMDIMLEGQMDGIEAASQIRSSLDVPVVYLTAHADEGTLERVKVTEPYGYVLKPFKELELRTVIEIALHKAQRERQSKKDEQPAPPVVAQSSPRYRDEDLQAVIDNAEKRKIFNYLLQIEPFNSVAPDRLKYIASRCWTAVHDAGDLIAFEGEKDVAGFVVISGRIAMVKSSPSGKELIVELIPPGDPFGLIVAVDTRPYPVTLKAQVNSEIIWVPKVLVLETLDDYPDLSQKLIREVFVRLRSAHDVSRALAHDLVEVRVASALLALIPRFCSAGEQPSCYKVSMTRQELADLTGTTPETVSRVMKAMERSGMLDLSQTGTVSILDVDQLKLLVTE